MFHLMSSLVNSRSECHVTPLRRLSLICRESGLSSQLSASMGVGFEVSSYSVMRSKGAQLTLPVLSRWPSMRAMSPTMPTRSVPPDFGCAAAGLAAACVGATLVGCPAGLVVGAGAAVAPLAALAAVATGLLVAGAADCGTPVQAASRLAPDAASSMLSAPRRLRRVFDRSVSGIGSPPM